MIDETHSNSRRHRLGSLGVLYATLFTRALGKEQVPVLADGARIARYRKQGFWYNDAPCDFNYTDAAARTEPVDLLLFAVKFVGLQNAIETCRHLVGPDTLVISVLQASPARRSWEMPLLRSMWSGAWRSGWPPRRRATASSATHWGTGSGRPRRGGHQPPPAAHRVF